MSACATAMKFENLPPEVLSSVAQWLTDLSSVVSFSQLTSATRSLFCDEDWRDICLRASFGRPHIWRDRAWRSITGQYYPSAMTVSKLIAVRYFSLDCPSCQKLSRLRQGFAADARLG